MLLGAGRAHFILVRTVDSDIDRVVPIDVTGKISIGKHAFQAPLPVSPRRQSG